MTETLTYATHITVEFIERDADLNRYVITDTRTGEVVKARTEGEARNKIFKLENKALFPDGWYWVRTHEDNSWEVAKLSGGNWLIVNYEDELPFNKMIIGPRIEPPDEESTE